MISYERIRRIVREEVQKLVDKPRVITWEDYNRMVEMSGKYRLLRERLDDQFQCPNCHAYISTPRSVVDGHNENTD